jgi:hypothetical protein
MALKSETFGTVADQATESSIKSELALRKLTTNGEGGIVLSLDDEGNTDQNEDTYDSLVPGYLDRARL